MDAERRKGARITKPLFVQYFDPTANIWNTSSIRNISEGGICFNTDSDFNPPQAIILRLRLPNNPKETLEIKARVIESKKYFTRFEFVEVSDTDKISIKNFIVWSLYKGGSAK